MRRRVASTPKRQLAAPHAEALKAKFAVALAAAFQRDHGKVEDRLEFREVDLVLAHVLDALRFIPADHSQHVYAK
jgi:hypothetical protein